MSLLRRKEDSGKEASENDAPVKRGPRFLRKKEDAPPSETAVPVEGEQPVVDSTGAAEELPVAEPSETGEPLNSVTDAAPPSEDTTSEEPLAHSENTDICEPHEEPNGTEASAETGFPQSAVAEEGPEKSDKEAVPADAGTPDEVPVADVFEKADDNNGEQESVPSSSDEEVQQHDSEKDPAEDTVLVRSDEEAHRNEVYHIPSKIKQTLVFTGIELRRISKTKRFISLFVLGIAMFIMLRVDFLASYVKLLIYVMFNIDTAYGAESFISFAL